uniref:Uncharacterized protein n=1 Tax=Panagrolaimus superbus TaxID=310955 RepID=A0A914YVH5_9BILA
MNNNNADWKLPEIANVDWMTLMYNQSSVKPSIDGETLQAPTAGNTVDDPLLETFNQKLQEIRQLQTEKGVQIETLQTDIRQLDYDALIIQLCIINRSNLQE